MPGGQETILRRIFSRQIEWAITVVCILLAVRTFVLSQNINNMVDDAFITYRYSANVINGHGLVYNVGEHVLGTMTPTYSLLMALGGMIFGIDQIPLASRVCNFLCIFIISGCIFSFVYTLTKRPLLSGVLSVLPFLSRQLVFTSTSGMESPFFLALLSIGLLSLLKKRWFSGVLVLGLLPVTRPEGAFVAVAATGVLIYEVYRHSIQAQKGLKLFAVLALPTLLYCILALSFYGSPIPHSIQAKSSGLYNLAPDYDTGALIDFTRVLLLGTVPDALMANISSQVQSYIVMAVMFLGSIWLIRRKAILVIIPVFVFGTLVTYAFSNTILFFWYFGLVEAPVLICWGCGIFYILSLVSNFASSVFKPLAKLGAIRSVIAVAISCFAVFYPLIHEIPWDTFANSSAHYPSLDKREYLYYQLTQRINSLLPPQTSILMPEVGVLGFYLRDAYVIDADGLISPQALAYFPIPESQRRDGALGAIPVQMVHDYKPDLVISLEIFGRYGILDDEWFQNNYTPVIVWTQGDGLMFDSQAFYVFSRNDFAAGLALRQYANQTP